MVLIKSFLYNLIHYIINNPEKCLISFFTTLCSILITAFIGWIVYKKQQQIKYVQEDVTNFFYVFFLIIRNFEEIINMYTQYAQKAVLELELLEQKVGQYQKIQVSNILIDVGNHKEINPIYVGGSILRHIDLRYISLENVDVSGIDFRGSNIILNPQEVYNKNLNGCNLEGIYISPFMNFNGVDIRGARFSRDNDPKTRDGLNQFNGAIYDETTTFDGESFTNIYGECNIKSTSK